MKSVDLNKPVIIAVGELVDCMGNVVGYDSITDEVTIRIDAHTKVVIESNNIEQD